MTSSPARASVTPSPLTSTRSLLSRLKLPLSSKSRNFTDFYIQSDDPHRQYAPGDIISGTVILKITKPVRITHLVISLHGYAQVFKNPNSPGDAYKTYSTTVGSGQGKKAGSYFGNGFVSLFEDEVVLCGEGRLSEGAYHFNFELEFPAKGLPSSIDFERGTIAYMLTATLTRPTTMSPTTSCDTKVYLTENVDIAPVLVPKPRIISLEPINRRSRARSSRRRAGTGSTAVTATATAPSEVPRAPTIPDALPPRPISTSNGTADGNDGPRSPSPSDVSYESQLSSGGASGTEYGIRSVHTMADGESQLAGSRANLKGKIITASIDVLKGGFLRGDQIPIRVVINHTKHVRSLKGIIITLYRQARVDMHPALPVVPNSKGGKTKSEDYYPKSRTGLGGLSLSSAGSSHLFRKDLCQSFAPLFVDPRTLAAEVKCTVRVPDEAFPTISNVPGAMISFKYYVEVVVDIQGKLTGLDRMVANAGLVNVPSTAGATTSSARDDNMNNVFSTWGGNFVDTDQIRREKGVVSALFEVIIGTKDSERNGKRRQTTQPLAENQKSVHEIPLNDDNNSPNAVYGYDEEYYGYDENGQYDANGEYYDYHFDPADSEVPRYDHHGEEVERTYRAPPRPEEGLSEKEQLRRAEARLLPSQPPDAGPSWATTGSQGILASAPIVPEDEDPDPLYTAAGSSAAIHAQPPPFCTASNPPALSYRPLGIQRNRTNATGNASSHNASSSRPTTSNLSLLPAQTPHYTSTSLDPAPQYFASSSTSAHVDSTDDKSELQRRRLELERSAPPPLHDSENDSAPNNNNNSEEQPSSFPSQAHPSAPPLSSFQSQSLNMAPSAPVLEDEEEDDLNVSAQRENMPDPVEIGQSNDTRPATHSDQMVSEALPVYRR